MHVELLVTSDCPTRTELEDLLQGLLDRMSPGSRVCTVLIGNEGEAQEQLFCGSPTIRVNGKDIDPEGGSALHSGLG